MSLTAYNPATVSQAYSLQFNVIELDETEIQPTEDFDKQTVKKLGKVKSPKENTTFSADISINESSWFNGTVLNYRVISTDEQAQNKTIIRNHVENTRKVVEARAIYDIDSTIDGIYAQQYTSVFKTYTHNDSIHYISHIPTEKRG